jgi:hypothetical protein
MVPRQSGETRTPAEGESRRWRARAEAGEDILMVVGPEKVWIKRREAIEAVEGSGCRSKWREAAVGSAASATSSA